jgi:hypothetical protein
MASPMPILGESFLRTMLDLVRGAFAVPKTSFETNEATSRYLLMPLLLEFSEARLEVGRILRMRSSSVAPQKFRLPWEQDLSKKDWSQLQLCKMRRFLGSLRMNPRSLASSRDPRCYVLIRCNAEARTPGQGKPDLPRMR